MPLARATKGHVAVETHSVVGDLQDHHALLGGQPQVDSLRRRVPGSVAQTFLGNPEYELLASGVEPGRLVGGRKVQPDIDVARPQGGGEVGEGGEGGDQPCRTQAWWVDVHEQRSQAADAGPYRRRGRAEPLSQLWLALGLGLFG